MNVFENGLQRYYSPQQLQKIQTKRIGIGGAGGLGSNVAVILTRSGFKHFEILDHDKIDASNLNRQHFFVDEIGVPKITALTKRLQGINPDVQITAHAHLWQAEFGEKFFCDCDFIFEAFDQAKSKHDFITFYQRRCPWIISGNGMAGLTQKQPMKIKKVGNVFFVGDLTTDVAQGHPPLAPRVTACAAMMAEVALDLTLGIPPAVSG